MSKYHDDLQHIWHRYQAENGDIPTSARDAVACRVARSAKARGASLMTRKELLTARANDVVEEVLSKDVCISESECQIMREVVLYELMRVEREVWGNVAEHLESEASKSLSFENALVRKGEMWCASDIQSQRLAEESYAAWARRQQQGIGE